METQKKNSNGDESLALEYPGLGYRHLMTCLLFFAACVSYAMRVDLSIAIVAMTDTNSTNTTDKIFDWSSTTQNTVQSSFFWGYIILQVPSGMIAQKLGARVILLTGITISTVATLLTPVVVTSGGWGAACALRVIEGLSQGTLFPSMQAVMSKWVPPNERGQMASIVYAGSQVGTIVTLAGGGVLMSALGWPSIFYAVGCIGLVWCAAWFFLSSSSPSEHKFISEKEKHYIISQIGEAGEVKSANLTTPWKDLLQSGPMWAIFLAHCCQNWGYWILMTEMPTYMKHVLGFDLKANGLLSALPYVAMTLLSLLFGFISDLIIRKQLMALRYSRKLFNSIGFIGPCIALICLGYTSKDQVELAVTLLVLAVGLNAGVYVGFQVNHIDLSPNYAATMMGITNGFSNILSIIGPLVVGIVVTDESSNTEWRIIFWTASAVYLTGNIIFVTLGRAEVQPWNKPKETEVDRRNVEYSSCK